MTYEELVQLGEEVGPGSNVGTTSSTKETIQTRVFNSNETVATNEDELPTCLICQTNFESGEILRTLQCSHEFHK